MQKIVFIGIYFVFFVIPSFAQEFFCKVNVNAEQITGVDAAVFKTMEQSITEFVNTRKWTDDAFQAKEKIEIVFTIIVNKKIDGIDGGYTGRLTVQTKRPIFNSSYTSNLLNYTDKEVQFKYIQFQPFDFNDNRVASNDALASNLSALIAYYCYIALGFDYDSFALKGGTDYFNRAQNIVNNAPENKQITGWKATESQKNRFWLIDQILNARFDKMRTICYQYHRLGLDIMSADAEKSRNVMNNLFPLIKDVNQENPGSMLVQFFFAAKSDEIQNFISGSTGPDKQKLVPMLMQLDVANANKYAALIK